MSFSDIPLETLKEYIIPLLGIKELGNLTICNKELKNICDSNDIWKIHYLKTLKGKYKITDKSVHLYGVDLYKYRVNNNTHYEYLLSRTKPDINCVKLYDYYNPYNQHVRTDCEFVEFYGNTSRMYNINNINNSLKWSSCTGCQCRQDKDFLTTLTNNITNDVVWNTPIQNQYERNKIRYDLVMKKWKEYNESKGLSQLCQNPMHYEFSTLELPASCRNFKNMKKQVIKKLYTQAKNHNSIKKDKYLLQRMNNKIMFLESDLRKAKLEKSKKENDIKREENKLLKLKICIDSI